MNDIIHNIRQRAKVQPKTIILPESQEPRIREAARQAQKQGIAKVLLLSPDKMDIQKIIFLLIMMLYISMVSLSASPHYTKDFNKTVEFQKNGKVSVKNINGRIQ